MNYTMYFVIEPETSVRPVIQTSLTSRNYQPSTVWKSHLAILFCNDKVGYSRLMYATKKRKVAIKIISAGQLRTLNQSESIEMDQSSSSCPGQMHRFSSYPRIGLEEYLISTHAKQFYHRSSLFSVSGVFLWNHTAMNFELSE